MGKVLFIMFLAVAAPFAALAGDGMTVPGAAKEDILHDCRVTAELSVDLLKMITKKTSSEKMLEAAAKLLEDRKYKGSFGDADFVAEFYTGMALQADEGLKKQMAEVKEEDFALMVEDHEVLCIKEAFGEGDAGGGSAGHGAMGGHGGMGGMGGHGGMGGMMPR